MHFAEFRFSSICSIFRSTWICAEAILLVVFTSALLNWILDLKGGQYQLDNLWFQVWPDVNKTIIHHHCCFWFVKFLKQSTFLVISTSGTQFRKYCSGHTNYNQCLKRMWCVYWIGKRFKYIGTHETLSPWHVIQATSSSSQWQTHQQGVTRVLTLNCTCSFTNRLRT